MQDHQATNQQDPVSALMARYAVAFRKHSELLSTEEAASRLKAPVDETEAKQREAEKKRRAAEKRELEFFLERLRFRLRKSGLSAGDLEKLEKQPEAAPGIAPAAATRSILKSARTAMLVIHGIGEQNPYQT